MLKNLFAFAAITLSLALFSQAAAQSPEDERANVAVSDPYGRSSPRGTVDGYLKAMREADATKAALFLDLQGLPEGTKTQRAIQLKRLLDDGGFFFLTDEISAAPEGNLKDEMSTDLEQVGALQAEHREIPLVLQRIAYSDDGSIWLFSRKTLEQLPSLQTQSRQSLIDQILPDDLKRISLLTVPIGHWIAMMIVAVIAVLIGWCLAQLSIMMLDWLISAKKLASRQLASKAIVPPLGIAIGVSLYRESVIWLGIQVVARGATDWIAVTIFWLAIAYLSLRLVDLISDFVRTALQSQQKHTSIAALILLQKIVKALIISVLSVQVLEILGFDVTTAIAALGIGGLALALGAQKTVENLVGSVNVVADRPVEVGDFCKFGDFSGTVEDIGIRSSKIRTPNRTLVTVPNGAFASMQIENFSARDMFLFNTVVSLRCGTTIHQLRCFLSDIQQHLDNAECIAEGARVNLAELTRSSMDIEIYAYVLAKDYSEYLQMREALLLYVLETASTAEGTLTFPPQLLEVQSIQPGIIRLSKASSE